MICKSEIIHLHTVKWFQVLLSFFFLYTVNWGNPRDVMVKAMDCEIVVSKFVLQLPYCVNFRANTLEEKYEPLILAALG